MERSQLILPQADSACGKLFYSDRLAADQHRIALEVWNRATGRVREGYRLAVLRCNRCGGFHIGRKPIKTIPVRTEQSMNYEIATDPDEQDYEPLRVRRISQCAP